MKKTVSTLLAVLLLVGTLAGCAEEQDAPEQLSYSDAYDQLIAYKTEGYQQQSVAEFNSALKSWYADDDSFRAACNTVAFDSALLPDDENYEFIKLTLRAALAELDAEARKDSDVYIFENRLECYRVSAAWGEVATTLAPDYEFHFCAEYWILYTVPDPSALTVEERDNTLSAFRTELQSYVDDLSEEELADEHIRARIWDYAGELAERISTEHITLSCVDIRDMNVIYRYPR